MSKEFHSIVCPLSEFVFAVVRSASSELLLTVKTVEEGMEITPKNIRRDIGD